MPVLNLYVHGCGTTTVAIRKQPPGPRNDFRYGKGDFFTDHFDDDPCGGQLSSSRAAALGLVNASCRVKSRRMVTVLIYLNGQHPVMMSSVTTPA